MRCRMTRERGRTTFFSDGDKRLRTVTLDDAAQAPPVSFAGGVVVPCRSGQVCCEAYTSTSYCVTPPQVCR